MDNIFLNACKSGNKAIVQTFLKKGGINLDKRDAMGNTPLYYVCLKGAKDIAKMLIDGGAEVSMANNASETPMHCVAKSGNKDIVTMLVDAGADINATDSSGNTPLIWSVRSGKTETSLYLISKGADIALKNNEGHSAFDYATAAGLRDLVSALSGGNVATKDEHGYTPLHQAVYNNQSETVNALLKASNSNINELADDGRSALMLAVQNSNIAIIELLLKNGADVSLNMLEGDSVLHYSASIGNRFVGKVLIDAGAEVNGRNT